MKKQALILFTRLPEAGRVKTRMMPRLSGEECAELQWAMLEDISSSLSGAEGDLFVFYAPPESPRALKRLRELLGSAEYQQQLGEGLGERMHHAFTHVFKQGYDACLLMGSDIPFVSRWDITAAWQELYGRDVVLGPSEDGGYWLVGLRRPFEPLFVLRSYGHGGVLAEAMAVCEACGLAVGLAATKRDADTWDDLYYLRHSAWLEKSPRLAEFIQKLFEKETDK